MRKINRTMVALGGYEIATFSFVSPKGFDKICLPVDSALRNTVTISNPLGEDTSVMRTTILPSMCEVLSRNYNNRNMSACLFEVGSEYIPTGKDTLPEEPVRLAIGLYGKDKDFYDIKGITEQLLDELNITDYEFDICGSNSGFDEAAAFHSGRCAVVSKDGKALGILGELSSKVLENYGIGVKAYAAKLLVPEMMAVTGGRKVYKPMPKFPAATRDIAVVCDDSIPAAKLEKAIKEAVGGILESVELFDVYKGKQIADGKKSVAYSIVMRSHDGTLTDEQADNAMKKVLKKLGEMGAEIRS
jgi:phenylalanyl-tRNA synthetase beta chain